MLLCLCFLLVTFFVLTPNTGRVCVRSWPSSARRSRRASTPCAGSGSGSSTTTQSSLTLPSPRTDD